eukprot:gene19116-biopygen30651
MLTPDSPPFANTLFPTGLRPGLPCFKHPASPDYNGYGSNWSGGAPIGRLGSAPSAEATISIRSFTRFDFVFQLGDYAIKCIGQFYAFNPATGILNISLNYRDPATVNCYTKNDAYWLILWTDGQRIGTKGEIYKDQGFFVSNPTVADGVIFSISNRTDFMDTRSLALFYTATDGKAWHQNDGWMSHSVPPCEWYGVTCGGSPPRVVGLNLSSNGVTGGIENLARLTCLTTIDLRTRPD